MPGHGIGPEISNAVKEVFAAAEVTHLDQAAMHCGTNFDLIFVAGKIVFFELTCLCVIQQLSLISTVPGLS